MRCSFTSAQLVHSDIAQNCRAYCQAIVDRVSRAEDSFFVFLHVFVVSERQAFHRRQRRREMTEHATGLSPN